MPITSTWTTPSSLDRAINDILTETIWDNLVSNELYLWDSLHNAAREVSLLRAKFATNGTGVAGSIYKDSAGGLVLWGVTGSAADFTLLNNAGGGVLAVPAGTANLQFNGRTEWTINVAHAAGSITKDAAGGLLIRGVTGSSHDFQIKAAGGGTAVHMPTGTSDLQFNGAVMTTAAANNTVSTRIAESVLGGTAASISFTSIPSNYRHLRVVMTARGDTAAQNVIINLRFNNDTGNNYDLQSLIADNTTITGGSSVGVSAIDLFRAPAASATASKFGHATFTVGAYKATDQHKEIVGHAHASNAGTAAITYNAFSGRWASTAAINRLDVFPAAGNFAAGTTVTLYGEP